MTTSNPVLLVRRCIGDCDGLCHPRRSRTGIQEWVCDRCGWASALSFADWQMVADAFMAAIESHTSQYQVGGALTPPVCVVLATGTAALDVLFTVGTKSRIEAEARIAALEDQLRAAHQREAALDAELRAMQADAVGVTHGD